MIKDRIESVREDIAKICQRIGQNPENITLVGVAKYASAEAIAEAARCGLTHIGENKLQDAQKKFADKALLQICSTCPMTKHMIGHLQSNKVKAALRVFDILQTVDSLKLADSIDRQAEHLGQPVDIFVQVNTSGESQKFGLVKFEVDAFFENIAKFSYLNTMGLMTIAPFVDDSRIIRNAFRDLRLIRDRISKNYSDHPHICMKYLSMGMTHDYSIAIEEGANMVRIGRAIFGESPDYGTSQK